MVLSLAVVGLVVAATFGVVAWQRPEVQGPIRPPVDVAEVVAQVQQSGPFPVWEPRPQGGWEATSAWFDTAAASDVDAGVLHVGFLTPDGSYAAVRQTDADKAVAMAEWVEGATETGTVEIDGRTWQRFESRDGDEQALVLVREDARPPVTVVVTGKADAPELEALAESLR